MSVLTQLFEAPTFNYSYFDNEPAIGSEDFGKAVLGAGMQFVRDSYLNTLALAQEEAMENGGRRTAWSDTMSATGETTEATTSKEETAATVPLTGTPADRRKGGGEAAGRQDTLR